MKESKLTNKISFQLRLTPEEKKTAETEAQKAGVSLNSFFRLLLKNYHDGITFRKETKDGVG